MTSVVISSGAENTKGVNILWDNILAQGTLTASTAATDGAAANAVDSETWDYWTPTAVPAWLKVDMTVATLCNGAALAAHTAGTAGSTIEVQSSPDDAAWTTRGTVTPTDDGVVFIAFPDVSARYWRLYVTVAITSIGVASIGERLTLSNSPLSGHLAISNSQKSTLLNTTTVSGQFRTNRVIRRGFETSVNMGLQRVSFVDGGFVPFRDHYNDGGTFFYCGSPLNWPNDVGYCWRSESAGNINPSYVEGGLLAELSMEVSAYAG